MSVHISSGRILIGLLLVIIGAVLFLSNIDVVPEVDFLWYLLLAGFGVYFIYLGCLKGVVFEGGVGVILLTLGLIGFTNRIGWSLYGFRELWTLIFVVFGLYLIYLYFPRRKRSLISWGILFILIGALYLLRNIGILPFSTIKILSAGWPLILVAVGLWLLLRRRRMITVK